MCFRPAAASMTNKCPKCGAECELDLTICPESGAELPNTPAMPGMPGAPGVPSAPGAPAAPGAPSAPKAPGQN